MKNADTHLFKKASRISTSIRRGLKISAVRNVFKKPVGSKVETKVKMHSKTIKDKKQMIAFFRSLKDRTNQARGCCGLFKHHLSTCHRNRVNNSRLCQVNAATHESVERKLFAAPR